MGKRTLLKKLEVFDIETWVTEDGVKAHCIAYSRGDERLYHVFKVGSAEEVSDFVLNNFKPGVVYYAHNLMFDFLVFMRGLIARGVKFSWLFIEYNLYEVTIHKDGARYTLRCSHKLLPFKLEQFYPSLCHARKMHFPFSELSEGNLGRRCAEFLGIEARFGHLSLGDYLELYALNDIKMLKEGLLAFLKALDELGIGYTGQSFTCGSIALNHYVSRYNGINLSVPARFKNVIKGAYYGGRCEVFGNVRDGEKLLHFDFKGMYQSCMLEDLPYGDFSYVSSGCDISRPGFYYAVVEYSADLPVLPMRDGKLYFKTGVVEGWYWHEELKFALEVCPPRSIEVRHGIVSSSNGKVLSEFIGQLGGLREQGGLKKEIGKLLINSFYGRLGLDNDLVFMRLRDSLNGETSYGEIDGLFLVKERVAKRPRSNVAIAAAITAKARIKLYKAFIEVQQRGGRMVYCDTDSVFAAFKSGEGVENKKLGEYVVFDTSKPDTVITDSVFISPKTYGLRLLCGTEIVRIKGVNTDLVSFGQLKESFYRGDESVSMRSQVFYTRNLSLGKVIEDREITLQSYDKRIWSHDRKHTSPHVRK